MMNRQFATVTRKADALFSFVPFVSNISDETTYENALSLMDYLIEDYDHNRPLIGLLEQTIARYENTAPEFDAFNRTIAESDSALAVLSVLMDQHQLGVSDLPEIGSKSLVSKILKGERQLTRKHIAALSKRFQIDPGLFF